ncbi:MAG: pseudouridine synthase [Porphyromonas sp.]|nr:pseudouridine synthase [Porphyromonas sp.]
MTQSKIFTQKETRAKGATNCWEVSTEDAVREVKLIDFLLEHMPNKSRTTIKQLIRDRFVSVDQTAETLATRLLSRGQVVELHQRSLPDKIHHPLIEILYQDNDIVVCAKKAGISTVASGIDKQHTALRVLSTHLKKYNKDSKLFMLNRLDKDSGGIVLFAKNRDAQAYFTDHWSEIVKQQVYRAVVEGRPSADRGLLLKPQPDQKGQKKRVSAEIIVSEDRILSKESSESVGVASYKVLKAGPFCSLLEIRLLSGRNNQIRRQMRQAGIPLAGDRHGGSVFPQLGEVALQCTKWVMRHPISGQEMIFTLRTSNLFSRLLKTPDPTVLKPKGMSQPEEKPSK